MTRSTIAALAATARLIVVASIAATAPAAADEAPSTAEILDHVLTNDELKQRLVGNTITGQYDDGKVWAAYYAPDGWVHGFDENTGPSMGRYAFRNGIVCFDYGNKDYNYCRKVSLIGDQVNFVWRGKVENDGNVNQRLVPGNAQDL